LRLLLDEMMPPRVAGELQGKGFDVQAANGERIELRGTPDEELVQLMAQETRAILTNDVRDFRPIHDRMLGAGESHAGLVFTRDSDLPRSRSALPLWVRTLSAFLESHPADDELRNRVVFLP
jgi:predicted nuclease of predicted toxin-antitoxin system